ncbi:hypothetical protein [Microbacterium sp. ProA8]|uniref:hypothetical protein n=1 Tax=Microbacterium chionoecetis TaxID=3153754 RepID=UPI0032651F37
MSQTDVDLAPGRSNAYRRLVADAAFRFRVLTIGNTANVVVSALAWVMSMASGPSEAWAWLQLLFPVVWAAAGAPILCVGITAFAAGMSLLALFKSPPGQRGLAWLRAFTGWGAVVLSLAFLLGVLLLSSRALETL